MLTTLSNDRWTTTANQEALAALESGSVLFLPQLHFAIKPEEHYLISDQFSNGKAKNISFNLHDHSLKGIHATRQDKSNFKHFMQRFAEHAMSLVDTLLPQYQKQYQLGRTSFRPIETAGRKNPSIKKDDTRLHIDAFPSNPNQGRRILRVFSNINPEGKPRVWRLGEPFINVAQKFVPNIRAPFPGSAKLLKTARITKSLRTPYDHYMLRIHDNMKADEGYQQSINFTEVNFPALSTWIVFTDTASHAALAGQHLLEQTFYLPVKAMHNPEKSPLRILETLLHRELST